MCVNPGLVSESDHDIVTTQSLILYPLDQVIHCFYSQPENNGNLIINTLNYNILVHNTNINKLKN